MFDKKVFFEPKKEKALYVNITEYIPVIELLRLLKSKVLETEINMLIADFESNVNKGMDYDQVSNIEMLGVKVDKDKPN